MPKVLSTAKHPVIILGGGSSNGLGIARNLGKQGIPVLLLTSNAWELTRFSKYCAGAAIIPQIEREAGLLHRRLVQLRRRFTGCGVLFPTTDTALLTVAQLQDTLDGYVAPIPTRELVETMVLKTRFYASLHAHNVPYPQTWALDHASWPQMIDQITFPVFIRPSQSLPFVTSFRVKGFVAQSLSEIHAALTRATQAGHRMMIQEIIPGPTDANFALRGFLDNQSQLIVLVANQRVRRFGTFRSFSVMQSVPLTTVEKFAKLLVGYLQTIGYTGLFMAEFKRDARDGRFKLLDLNARSAGDNHFVTACGVNHILAAYQTALGQPVMTTLRYKTGIFSINIKLDLYQSVRRLLLGHLTPNFLGPYLGKTHWHSLSTDDPWPFLVDLITR